jgi:3-hydroxyacyl-[acyl-carrier-protein] dehydratase
MPEANVCVLCGGVAGADGASGPNGARVCVPCVDRCAGQMAERGTPEGSGQASAEVLEAIPHRPPFLFVDRILECTETRLVAERVIRATEPQFRGHYPGTPITPGVLLCEAVIQAGALLVSRKLAADSTGVPVLTRIQDARFKRMVRPGDTVRLEAELADRLQDVFFFKGRASVGGQKALLLEFAVTLAPAEPKGKVE